MGDYPAQLKLVEYGPVGAKERAGMRWSEDIGVWVGDPHVSIALRDAWIMNAEALANVYVDTAWGYVTIPFGNPGRIGQSSYSWSPRAIRHADAAFAAGLKLQENVIADAWVWHPGDELHLATVWYPLAPGEKIDNAVLMPDDFIGTDIRALGGVRQFQCTGWHNSLMQASSKPNLAPHLYSKMTLITAGPNTLEYWTSYWRWVFTPPMLGEEPVTEKLAAKSRARAKPRARVAKRSA